MRKNIARRLERLKRVRAQIEAAETPGDPESVFEALLPIKPGFKYFIAARVSRSHQKKHLKHQLKRLIKLIEVGSGIIIGKHAHIGPGWDISWLKTVFDKAVKLGADAVVMESVDRFVRPPTYTKKNQKELPSRQQIDEFVTFQKVNSLRLMVVVPPNEDPGEVRSYQIRRGLKMRAKKKKPGYMKKRRREWKQRAVELIAQGFAYAEVAQEIESLSGLPIAQSTIYRWAQEEKTACTNE